VERSSARYDRTASATQFALNLYGGSVCSAQSRQQTADTLSKTFDLLIQSQVLYR
jgi:hypothetical protein